jgi:hypothetical protein
VQAGAFAERGNAERLVARVHFRQLTHSPAHN